MASDEYAEMRHLHGTQAANQARKAHASKPAEAKNTRQKDDKGRVMSPAAGKLPDDIGKHYREF
jgi:hypothetical protein